MLVVLGVFERHIELQPLIGTMSFSFNLLENFELLTGLGLVRDVEFFTFIKICNKERKFLLFHLTINYH